MMDLRAARARPAEGIARAILAGRGTRRCRWRQIARHRARHSARHDSTAPHRGRPLRIRAWPPRTVGRHRPAFTTIHGDRSGRCSTAPWTTTEVGSPQPQPPMELCPQPPGDPTCRLTPCTEIGIGLTGAGLLFMVLGMMMFFDKGLLAMGNVRRVPGGPCVAILALLCPRPLPASAPADPVPCGRHDDHRHEQDLPLLLPEA